MPRYMQSFTATADSPMYADGDLSVVVALNDIREPSRGSLPIFALFVIVILICSASGGVFYSQKQLKGRLTFIC